MASLPARARASRIFERAAAEAATRARRRRSRDSRVLERGRRACVRTAPRGSRAARVASCGGGARAPRSVSPHALEGAVRRSAPEAHADRVAPRRATLDRGDRSGARTCMARAKDVADPAASRTIPGLRGAMVWGFRARPKRSRRSPTISWRSSTRADAAHHRRSRDHVCTDLGNAGPFERSIGKIAQALLETIRAPTKAKPPRFARRCAISIASRAFARANRTPTFARTIRSACRGAHALAAFAAEGARAAYGKAQVALETMLGAHRRARRRDATKCKARSRSARRSRSFISSIETCSSAARSTICCVSRHHQKPDEGARRRDDCGARSDRVVGARSGSASARPRSKKDSPVKDAVLRLPTPSRDAPPRRQRSRRRRSGAHAERQEALGDDREPVLLNRMATGLPPILRRANAATLSRTLDALARAEALDPADALRRWRGA